MEDRNLFLEGLNDKQKEAVVYTEGPLLILAGAGSGKTRVLTYRTGYLISQGVAPWNILAITFTNKAAKEMRERVDRLPGGGGQSVFVSTFHSMCVRLLRPDIDKLGFTSDFTIYDTDDARTLVRNVIKNMNLDVKVFRERAVLARISAAKNEMLDPEDMKNMAADYYEENAARIYAEYQKLLKENNALDFDDLLLYTVKLFTMYPDVLEKWQNRFLYIMVDEYQDTNHVQFELVRLLSSMYRNLCVVGDDDQSIYKFRGADIRNILDFEKAFPGTKVIKLEQNYRSTKAILAAANCVIHNNTERKDKILWTDNEDGKLPEFNEYVNAQAEAEAIIREASSCGFPLREQAVLYRTNAQSRLLEERCVRESVPYVVVGGVNFYQRKEIKDILAYLRVISNGIDDLSCERIINTPRRGIGQTSIGRLKDYAADQGISLYDAMVQAFMIPGLNAAAAKIDNFVTLIEHFRERSEDPSVSLKTLIETVLTESGYEEELKKEGPVEYETRREYIEEMISKAASYEENQESVENRGLAGFLAEVALVSDIDRTSDTDDVLTLMTIHAAKGLEFGKVYLCGMEEGLFPSVISINSEDPEQEIEEERRLCYVGITRAIKELKLSSASERMINGEARYQKPSRFIDEIDGDKLTNHSRRRKNGRSPYAEFSGNTEYTGTSQKRIGSAKQDFAQKYGGFGRTVTGSSNHDVSCGIGQFGSLELGNRSGTQKRSPVPMPNKGIVKCMPDYHEGDRVKHVKFGTGTVLEITDGPRDYEVRVAFDGFGEKKMLAGFAKLEKI